MTIDYVDPLTLLTPWDGQTLTPIDETDAAPLIEQFTSDPASAAVTAALGAFASTDDATGATTVVIFLELTDDPGADGADQFYSGVLGDNTDVTDVVSGTHQGKAFLSDGSYGFVTLFGTTAVLATSPDADALQTTVDSMFAANPQL